MLTRFYLTDEYLGTTLHSESEPRLNRVLGFTRGRKAPYFFIAEQSHADLSLKQLYTKSHQAE